MRGLVHKLEPVENGVDCRRALHQAYHAVRGNIIQEHRRNPGMRHCVTPLEVAERIAGIFFARVASRKVLFGSPCGIYVGTNPPMDAGFLELLDRWMPEIHAQACELASEVGALLLTEDIRTITERNGGEDR